MDENEIKQDGVEKRPYETARKVTKGILGGAAGIGAGMIVGYAVTKVTPGELKTYKKVLVKVGAAGISTAVSAWVKKSVNDEVDEAFDSLHDLETEYKKAREEQSNG